MACIQTLNGLAKDCTPSMGGIEEILLNCADNVTGVTLDTSTSSEISGVTLASPAVYFKKYQFRPETGMMTTTATIDPATGVNQYATEVALVFSRMETAKRKEIALLGLADLVCIVKDNNGKYWYLGKDFPVVMTANTGETGTARGDANRYTLTLKDVAKQLPYEVQASVIPGLLAAQASE